jgi:mRNA interferase MazF
MLIKRGDIFWVNLDPAKGSEQAGKRSVLIIQNDIGNEFAPTVIVAALTTAAGKEYPTRVLLYKGIGGLRADSCVLLSQIRTIDKSRLEQKVGHLPASYMQKVNESIKTSLGIS